MRLRAGVRLMLVSEDTQAVLNARVGVAPPSLPTPAAAVCPASARSASPAIELTLHDNLAAAAATWRAFEAVADCTAFQTFAWHDAWQRHIGERCRTAPAIVEGRQGGRLLFIMPLAVEHGHLARRLVWHASDLCDYNAPLLAKDFSKRVTASRFAALWEEIGALVGSRPCLRRDVVILERMPEVVAAQANPFAGLPVTPHASGAYLMHIAGDWETFYKAKRSSATRRHDRAKAKRLAEAGAVSLVTASDRCDVEAMLTTLFAQKAVSFARRGVPNFLARPGYRDFYVDVASAPATRSLVHVSKLQVGDVTAATNLGFMFGHRYYHVVASYDAGELSRHGPGTAHLHALIAYALDHGCTEFDFTVGDEPYKRDWCDSETKLFDLRLASNLRGWAVAAAAGVGSRLKRCVKRSPALWRAFTNARLVTARVRRNSPPPESADRASRGRMGGPDALPPRA